MNLNNKPFNFSQSTLQMSSQLSYIQVFSTNKPWKLSFFMPIIVTNVGVI